MTSPETQIPPVNRFGLTEVSSPRPASVDVVFVHGLNGDPHNTWTAEKSKIFWPAQLLPPILEEEKVRVLVYGYDADVTSFTDGASKDKIHNHAEHLVAELAANRRIRKATQRPIIFVAHSLGGLVVKRALIHSSDIRGTKTEHLRSIFISTYGILFLGTPHKGSDVAQWGSRLEWICNAVMPSGIVNSSDQLVDALKTNNETLQNIDRQFTQLMDRFHIFFFHEAKPTFLKVGKLKGKATFIVDEDSASPTVQDVERAAIQADHSHMCKFESDSAPGFDLVAEAVQRYADEAPVAVKAKWASEVKERVIQREAAVEQLLPGSVKGTPQSDSSSTFESAPGTTGKTVQALPAPDQQEFLESQYTVEEFEDEPVKVARLVQLSQKSSKADLKDDATTTADLPSESAEPNKIIELAKPNEPFFIVPPGFRPNTFFVGMEKEIQELDRRLFDKRRREGTACVLLWGQPGGGKSHLARQYVHKNRTKFEGGIFWITSGSKEERWQAYWNIHQKVITRSEPELCAKKDGREYIEIVKAWFESRHEWLIIFDGVSLDQDEDATEFQKFVPDSRNSSIIYLSRAKNLESKQRLLRPSAIRVTSLKEDDARKLLFKELHIKHPTEAERRKGTELVKKVGGLPLAIDAISHRIADTHEPLAKFNIKSYSADPRMGGTYNKILDDLQRLGYMEAWNLISILCFFGQHIPVEMVHLGMKSLKHDNVEVKSSENGGNPDINTTFGILMRYALIERNEPEDKESPSSSRDSLVGPEPIDVLKVHSVVQSFCCDSLQGMNILPTWLGYAARLFGYSFHQADVRIKSKPAPGRVSDYREYLTHGQRLWDNSEKYRSGIQPLDDARRHLKPILDTIREEIQFREPSSSQESLTRGVFQISIFDRTSSSSESNQSLEIQTPKHRPSPLPLPDENMYSFPPDKPMMDSPNSFGTMTPPHTGGLRIIGSPRLPSYNNEDGYESDREGLTRSQPMRKIPSDNTARLEEQTPRPPEPHHRSRAPTGDSSKSGWQIVSSTRKIKKTRGRRDLGSFRPLPAMAQVSPRSAAGSVAKLSGETNQRRPSSDAFSSLSDIHKRSPPPSRDTSVGSFWKRISPSAPSENAQPTWASIVAGQKQSAQRTQPVPSVSVQPSAATAIMERGRSRESLRPRPSNTQHSPLASQYLPGNDSLPGPGTVSPQPEDSYAYYPPPQLGPNPNPFPSYEIIPTPTKRRLPSEFVQPQSHADSHSPLSQPPVSAYPTPPSRLPSQSPHSPAYQAYLPPYPSIPTGYTSQPMSRHGSRQSRESLAETEPPRYMPSGLSPQTSYLPPYYDLPPSSSPRDRLPDGRPVRKSPRQDYATPAQPPPAFYPPQADGGWTYNSSRPASQHSSPGRDHLATTMSRSSSGPGFAIESPAMGGLGIVPLDGRVQFGEHEAISLEEARRRTGEYELRLREAEMEGLRRRGRVVEGREGAPYPDVDVMPTDAEVRRRPRGFSAPEREEVGAGWG
ncbi:MAG: hypothetical protein Q9195_008518 [Heterodermia aff. obscurata]